MRETSNAMTQNILTDSKYMPLFFCVNLALDKE